MQAFYSLYFSLCQMEAVPLGAQGCIGNGPVDLSLGAENQHASLRWSDCYAVHGSHRWRDSYC